MANKMKSQKPSDDGKNYRQLKQFFKFWLRVTVGAVFLQMGWLKLQNPQMIIGMVNGLHLPFAGVLGWLVLLSELICGGLLVIGFWTKYAPIPLMIIMTVAFFGVHINDGLVLTTWAVIILFLSLGMFATSGPGNWSLDHKINSKN